MRRFYVILLGLLGILGTTSAQGLDLYVAVDGNDAWTGLLKEPNAARSDGPFATLQRARDAIRAWKTSGRPSEPVTVYVCGGAHFLAEPLVLTPQDSGSAECPITYTACPGEHPLLSGGRRISDWKQAEPGRWQADVPEAKEGKWPFRQLWVNGGWRQRPRKPDTGAFPVVNTETHDKSSLRCRPGDFQESWARRDDLEIVVLQFWTEARLPLKEIDSATHTLLMKGGSWRPLNWASGYYAENMLEGLEKPGQWYLDRAKGVVLYVPQEGEDRATLDAIAPALEQLVRLEGAAEKDQFVRCVKFRGLHFAHTAFRLPEQGLAYPQGELPVSAIVYAQGAQECAIEDCEFSNADSWAVELRSGCTDNQICGNTIRDLGAGGIKIGNGSELLAPYDAQPEEWNGLGDPRNQTHGNVIADNTLRDGAKNYFGACAVWVGQSSGNRIAHNEISGTWQFAISVGWNWGLTPPTATRDNLVEWNHVHHIGGRLGSHSSIYALGVQPGTIIRNNLVHHGMGYGLGFDESSTGIVAENNLIHHQETGGLHFNRNCLGNIVQNNVFALNGSPTRGQLTRWGDRPRGEDANCNVFMRNIVYWDNNRLWNEREWPNFRMITDYNLYWDVSGRPIQPLGFSWEEWTQKSATRGFKLDRHSLVANPEFINAQKDDFRLKPDSPAAKIGFEPFDLSTVGPRGK